MSSPRGLRANATELKNELLRQSETDKAHKKQIKEGLKSIGKGTAGLFGIKKKKKKRDFIETSDNLIDIEKGAVDQSSTSCFSFFSCCTNCCETESEEERRSLLINGS